MKTIVVGYDDTEPARRALERAAELATAYRATVVVTCAAPLPIAQPDGFGLAYGAIAAPPPATEEEQLDLARARLESAGRLLRERGIEAELVPLVEAPADAILDLAERRSADLVVVGTREPGFVARLLGGSVSDQVARRAHVDVLIVH